MTITETLPGTGFKPPGVCDCCEHVHDDPLVEVALHERDHYERTEGDREASICADCIDAAENGALYPIRLNRIGEICEWFVEDVLS